MFMFFFKKKGKIEVKVWLQMSLLLSSNPLHEKPPCTNIKNAMGKYSKKCKYHYRNGDGLTVSWDFLIHGALFPVFSSPASCLLSPSTFYENALTNCNHWAKKLPQTLW